MTFEEWLEVPGFKNYIKTINDELEKALYVNICDILAWLIRPISDVVTDKLYTVQTPCEWMRFQDKWFFDDFNDDTMHSVDGYEIVHISPKNGMRYTIAIRPFLKHYNGVVYYKFGVCNFLQCFREYMNIHNNVNEFVNLMETAFVT